MSQLFTSGGQSFGVSVSASVFPMNIQDLVSFRMDISYILKIRYEMSSTFFFL